MILYCYGSVYINYALSYLFAINYILIYNKINVYLESNTFYEVSFTICNSTDELNNTRVIDR